MTKTCNRCTKTLPIESFGVARHTRDGRRIMCRECRGRYRSARYGTAGSRAKSHEQRARGFWALVEKTDGCWLWKGRKNNKGYGHTSYENRDVLAHRLAWFFIKGVWPEKFLLHHCDTPLCCRVDDHLFEGTQAENMQDAARKGRLGRKTKHAFLQEGK